MAGHSKWSKVTIFSKPHGSLAEGGSVAYFLFQKGQLTVPLSAAVKDRILELELDAGTEGFGSGTIIALPPRPSDRLYAVGEALKNAGLTAKNLKLNYIPEELLAKLPA